jgi:hypothetical protein
MFAQLAGAVVASSGSPAGAWHGPGRHARRTAAPEVGMIQSSPNALLAEGTDWRFLNELKRELKA